MGMAAAGLAFSAVGALAQIRQGQAMQAQMEAQALAAAQAEALARGPRPQEQMTRSPMPIEEIATQAPGRVPEELRAGGRSRII